MKDLECESAREVEDTDGAFAREKHTQNMETLKTVETMQEAKGNNNKGKRNLIKISLNMDSSLPSLLQE